MTSTSLLKRQKRIASRNKAIEKDYCPNCNVPLREGMYNSPYCAKCNYKR